MENKILELADNEAAAVAVAPRVTLDGMKAKISGEYYFTAGDAAFALNQPSSVSLSLLTLCILEMQNGFTIVGKSACASPENFNEELGKKIAYEDAINQLWAFEGYVLRNELMG